jgi:hypothetical protein
MWLFATILLCIGLISSIVVLLLNYPNNKIPFSIKLTLSVFSLTCSVIGLIIKLII